MLGTMALIAFLLPVLIGLFNRKILNGDIRFWVSFVICAFFGISLYYIDMNGTFTGMTMSEVANGIADSVLKMVGLVKLSFEAVWDNKAVSKLLPDEVATDNETPLKGMGLKPF